MSTWRRKALEAFPQLHRDLQDSDFKIYELFFELRIVAEDALRATNDDQLRRVFGFAAWCFSQSSKDLWNAAGVAFYEHLFDRWELRQDVVPWLTSEVVESCWSLWEARLDNTGCQSCVG